MTINLHFPPKAMNKYLFLLLLTTLAACKKFDIEPGAPECIKNTARERTKDVNSEYATILEYEFQGKLVYVFDLNAGNPDSQADIFDSNCTLLGYLGGISGNRIINGEDFSNAVFKRKIWPIKK